MEIFHNEKVILDYLWNFFHYGVSSLFECNATTIQVSAFLEGCNLPLFSSSLQIFFLIIWSLKGQQ